MRFLHEAQRLREENEQLKKKLEVSAPPLIVRVSPRRYAVALWAVIGTHGRTFLELQTRPLHYEDAEKVVESVRKGKGIALEFRRDR